MKLIGTCENCKFWDPKDKSLLYRICKNKEMQSHQRTSYQQDEIETDNDFGCIFFEQKE